MPDNRLYIIDLDRTILSVGEVMKLAENVCGELGIDFEAIKNASEQAEGTGWSYSPLKAIEEIADDEQFERFKSRFIETADLKKLIYPDARRFIDKLDELNKPYMILTFALDERWQKLKLAATKLDKVPFFITENAIKSKDISGWVDDSGNLTPPVAGISPAASAWLIDDRGRVFDGLPGVCEGFYLKRPDSADKRAEALPAGSRQIASFDELIDKI